MKKVVFLLTMFLVTQSFFSQEKKYYTDKNIARVIEDFPKFAPWHSVYDSLQIKRKILYFKNSPIDYLDGFGRILYDNYLVLPKLCHGYILVWKIEGEKLYINRVSAYRTDYISDTIPSVDKRRDRLENFLGRKFDKKGIFADFVTGKFLLYKYPLSLRHRSKEFKDKNKRYLVGGEKVYAKDIQGKQEIYIAEFKEGMLIKFYRDKEKEKEYKEWEKGGLPIFYPSF